MWFLHTPIVTPLLEILPAEAGWALVELPRNYFRRAWADATLRALDGFQTWEAWKENGSLSKGKVSGLGNRKSIHQVIQNG